MPSQSPLDEFAGLSGADLATGLWDEGFDLIDPEHHAAHRFCLRGVGSCRRFGFVEDALPRDGDQESKSDSSALAAAIKAAPGFGELSRISMWSDVLLTLSYCRTPFSLLTTTSPSRTWLAALRGSGTPPAMPTMRMYSTDGKLRTRFVTAADETLLPILASEVSNTWWGRPSARLGRVPHQYWLPSSAEAGLTGAGSSRINRHAANSLGNAVQMAKRGW